MSEINKPLLRLVPGLALRPRRCDKAICPEPSNAAVGVHPQSEVREGRRRLRNGEEVTRGRAEGHDGEKRRPVGRVIRGRLGGREDAFDGSGRGLVAWRKTEDEEK
jgi:hypothetical protein